MKVADFLVAALFVLQATQLAYAQHCPPIVESYLSELSVKHDKTSIAIRVEYAKNGGQPKAGYQAYLLAYLEKHRAKVPASPAKDLIDKEVVAILHTQLIKRNEQGRYEMDVKLDCNELAKKMIEHGNLTEQDRSVYGGWGQYNDRIRIAVFIPFLDDERYSVLDGLPEDKHECNYSNERALLLQQLPNALSIHFGIVQAVRLDDGEFHIQINGDKPRKGKP